MIITATAMTTAATFFIFNFGSPLYLRPVPMFFPPNDIYSMLLYHFPRKNTRIFPWFRRKLQKKNTNYLGILSIPMV